MSLLVKKASGEQEKFNTKKLQRSLRQAGVGQALIDDILKEITKIRPQSTKAIHAHVARLLKKAHPPLAARYNLKRALIDLGPAGYPFEQFVAELFSRQGYKSTVGKRIRGKCIEHEVDVVAEKGREQPLWERGVASSSLAIPTTFISRDNPWQKKKSYKLSSNTLKIKMETLLAL